MYYLEIWTLCKIRNLHRFWDLAGRQIVYVWRGTREADLMTEHKRATPQTRNWIVYMNIYVHKVFRQEIQEQAPLITRTDIYMYMNIIEYQNETMSNPHWIP